MLDAPLDHEATSWTPGRPARAASSSYWRSQGGYPLLGRLGSSSERPESSPPGTELAYRPPSRVVMAVRKLQAAMRERLQFRRRRQMPLFEMDDPALGSDLRPRRPPGRCMGCVRRRRRTLCAVCMFIVVWIGYATAVLVDLARGLGCGADQCVQLERLRIGDLCGEDVAVDAELRYRWRPWATVGLEHAALEVTNTSGAVVLTATLRDRLTLIKGDNLLTLNATIGLGPAAQLAAHLRALASPEGAVLRVSSSLRVHSKALGLPLSLSVPLSAELECSQETDLTCTLNGTPLRPPPSPPPGDGGGGGGTEAHLEALALSQPGLAELAAAMRLRVSLPLSLPLTATLPPLSMDLGWSNVSSSSSSSSWASAVAPTPSLRGTGDAPPLSVALDGGAHVEDGEMTLRPTATLRAATVTQGESYQRLLAALLRQPATDTDAANASLYFSASFAPGSGGGPGPVPAPSPPPSCYLQSLLEEMSPFPLAVAMPDLPAILNASRSAADADGGGGGGGSGPAGSNVSLSVGALSFAGLLNQTLLLRAAANLSASFDLSGQLPPLALSLDDDDHDDDHDDASAVVANDGSAPLLLLQVPAVSLGATRHALSVAASLTARPRLATLAANASRLISDMEAMQRLCSSLSVGAAIGTDTPPGLRRLRLPVGWLLPLMPLSPQPEPEPANQTAAGALVRVRSLGLDAPEGGDGPAQMSLGASLERLSLRRGLELRSGLVAIAALDCAGSGGGGGACGQLGSMRLQPLTLRGADATAHLGVEGSWVGRRALDEPLAAIWLRGSVTQDDVALLPGEGRIELAATTIQAFAHAWDAGGGGSSAGGGDGGGPSVNVSVEERSAEEAAVVVSTAAEWAMPIGVALPSLSFELTAADAPDAPAVAVAGAETEAVSVSAGDAPGLRGALLLSEARRTAVGATVQRLLDDTGAAVTLCATGGLAADAADAVRICANVSRPGNASDADADDGGGRPSGTVAKLLANASVDFLGGAAAGADVDLPCVLPLVCEARTVAQLRALAPTPLTFGAKLPLWLIEEEIDGGPQPLLPGVRWRLQLPPTALQLGIDAWQPMLEFRLPEIDVDHTDKELIATTTLLIADWYAVSRLAHGTGQAQTVQDAANHTARLRGSRAASSGTWSRVLPELTRTLVAPPPGTPPPAPLLILPSVFHTPSHEAGEPPPPTVSLAATTATSVSVRVPVGLRSPLPIPLALRPVSAELQYQEEQPQKATLVARMTLEGGGELRIAPYGNTTATLLPTALADGGVSSCLASASCYASPQPKAQCVPCALGRLSHDIMSFAATRLKGTVALLTPRGDVVRVSCDATLFVLTDELHDAAAAFARRDSTFLAVHATENKRAAQMRNLLHQHIDIMSTLEATLTNWPLPSGKSIDTVALIIVQNVFAVPFGLSRVHAGGVYLHDHDGVLEHGALMGLPGDDSRYPADARFAMVSGVDHAVSYELQPGEAGAPLTLRLPMLWEAVVRYVDEIYAKAQMCIAFNDGLLSLSLDCARVRGAAAAACEATAPFRVSLAFALDALGQFKRRACHRPASCSPRGATLSPQGGFGGERVAATGSAAVQQDGTLALVTRHADDQAGSAFLTKPLPLLHGFNATFTFRLNDPCTSIFSCPSLSGGFAFVLRAGAPPHGAGGACEVEAYVVLPKFPGGSGGGGGGSGGSGSGFTDNRTAVSCSGYRGVDASLGVVFSVTSNQFYSSMDHLSSTSDYPRGTVSLWLNGDVRDSTTLDGAARGVSQDGAAHGLTSGEHTASVVYSPTLQMLYVHLDGAAVPALWAPLAPEEMPAPPDTPVWAGFTAHSGAKMVTELSSLRIDATATDGAASALLEAGQVVGRVGEQLRVHLDPRDSCGLPRAVTHETEEWHATITAADGEAVPIDSVSTEADGTLRLAFRARQAGTHHVGAALTTGGPDAHFSADFTVLDAV